MRLYLKLYCSKIQRTQPDGIEPPYLSKSAILEGDIAFAEAGLAPNIVLTALDADVISTYVGVGMGVGTIAEMAFEGEHYRNLVKIPTKIFGKHVTWIATRADGDLRTFGKAFIDICQQQFS